MFNQLRKKILSDSGGKPTQVYVCSFGKHPGWSDHAEPIGLETDRLREFKRMFYDDGFREAIESGAWDELQPEQRIEELDHVLLWRSEHEVIVGRFWSSTDKAGRPKYPMVVAAQCQGLPLIWALQVVLPALRELEGALRATESVEAVRNAVFATRDALRSQGADRESVASNVAADRTHVRALAERFQGDPSRGIEGFSRILYRINRVGISAMSGASSGTGTTTRLGTASEARVPWMADSLDQAMHQWARLVAGAVDARGPFFMMAPENEKWIDLIVGEPRSSHVVLVRKNLKAVPLTTDVPYSMEAEFRRGLDLLLSDQPVAVNAEQASTRPARTPDAQEQQPASTTQPQPEPEETKPKSKPESGRRRLLGRKLWVFIAIGAIAVGGSIGAWWIFTGNSSGISNATATGTDNSSDSSGPLDQLDNEARAKTIEEIRALLKQLPRGQPVADIFERHLALVENQAQPDSSQSSAHSGRIPSSPDDPTLLNDFRAWLGGIHNRELDWDCLLDNSGARGAGSDPGTSISNIMAVGDPDQYEVIRFSEDDPRWSAVRAPLREVTSAVEAIDPAGLPQSLRTKREELAGECEALQTDIEQVMTCRACLEHTLNQYQSNAASLRRRSDELGEEVHRLTSGRELESLREELQKRLNDKLEEVESTIRRSNALAALQWLPGALADRTDVNGVLASDSPAGAADKKIDQLNQASAALDRLADSFNPLSGAATAATDSWRRVHAAEFVGNQEDQINSAWAKQQDEIASIAELASFFDSQARANEKRKLDLDAIFEGRIEIAGMLNQNVLPTGDFRTRVTSWDELVSQESEPWILDSVRSTRELARSFLATIATTDPGALWSLINSPATASAIVWAAWDRLQSLHAVPDPIAADSLEDLVKLVQARDALNSRLDSGSELDAHLPPDARTLWRRFVQANVFADASPGQWSGQDQSRLDQALAQRDRFGFSKDDSDLPEDVRFNMLLVDLAASRSASPSEIADKLPEWLDQLGSMSGLSAATTLASSLRMLDQQSGGEGSPVEGNMPELAEDQVVGPEHAGWKRVGDSEQAGRLTFASPVPGSDLVIAFRPVFTEDDRTAYVAEAEASIALCSDILADAADANSSKSGLASDVVSRLAGVTTWSGPKAWSISQQLTANQARPGSGLVGWLDPAGLSGMRQILPNGSNFPGEMYPQDGIPNPPNERDPMQFISASEAVALAMLCGCRLPTEHEWNEAVRGAGGLDRISRTANLRDTTWMRQRDHLLDEEERFDRARGGGNPDAVNLNLSTYWPDANTFTVDNAPRRDVPSGGNAELWSGDLQAFSRAPDFPYADGTLWFRPADEMGESGPFANLVGNVSEFVFKDDPEFVGSLEDAISTGSIPPSALGVARLLLPSGDGPAVGVIGGSALSAPEGRLNVLHSLLRGQVAGNRFSDVGFRLAFRARTRTVPKVSMPEGLSTIVDQQVFLSRSGG